MKVLCMTKPGNASPWYEDFLAALGDGFDVEMWAPHRSFPPQVESAVAVADIGAFLEPAMIPQARAAGVKLWQMISAGYDQLDLDLFRANGIPVANTPGQFSARALAEHALMLMLCSVKGFSKGQQDLKSGIFYRSFGNELAGRTLGLVGLGASGRELARLGQALSMRVIGIDPVPPAANEAARFGIEVLGGPDELHDLLAAADVISIHVPLLPSTRGMIGRPELASMKPSSVLVNVSRGQIVDQAALVEVLQSKQIAGAGLDVFVDEPLPLDDPLLTFDNVVLTPHVAGSTYETSRRRGAAAAENVHRVAKGDNPLYVVTC